jgi:micrococcal nuclease
MTHERPAAILCLAGLVFAAGLSPAIAQQRAAQQRPSGEIIPVPIDKIDVDDGDTATIRWSDGDREVVRFLGIDTPEIAHPEFSLPFDQPFGREAAGFAKGAFAVARRVGLRRAAMKDPYGRTLGYMYLDGRNYSPMILKARLAYETASRYGDNGLAPQADSCLTAGREAGALPFEDPHDFRQRMRLYSDWLKANTEKPKN